MISPFAPILAASHELATHAQHVPHSRGIRGSLGDYISTELPIVHPKAAGHEPFERSTPLFEVGGIDSLSIIHIVSFLEAAMGTTLSLRDINMKNFRTVEEIADLFWMRKSHGSKC